MADEPQPQIAKILDYAQADQSRRWANANFWALLGVCSCVLGSFVRALDNQKSLSDFGPIDVLAQLAVCAGGICYIIARSLAEKSLPILWRILTAMSGFYYLWVLLLTWRTITFWPYNPFRNWSWYCRQDDYQSALLAIASAVAFCVVVRFIAFFFRKKPISTQVE